jgi:precorrin isomerase
MYSRETSSQPYEVSKLAQIASPFISCGGERGGSAAAATPTAEMVANGG